MKTRTVALAVVWVLASLQSVPTALSCLSDGHGCAPEPCACPRGAGSHHEHGATHRACPRHRAASSSPSVMASCHHRESPDLEVVTVKSDIPLEKVVAAPAWHSRRHAVVSATEPRRGFALIEIPPPRNASRT